MTKQEIYNIAKTGLLAQNQKAIELQTGCCKLRALTNDGKTTKCSIGHLIPDKLFDRMMDNSALDMLVDNYPFLAEYLYATDIDFEFHQLRFITGLQAIHDRHDPKEWPDEFTRFAEKWGLQP